MGRWLGLLPRLLLPSSIALLRSSSWCLGSSCWDVSPGQPLLQALPRGEGQLPLCSSCLQACSHLRILLGPESFQPLYRISKAGFSSACTYSIKSLPVSPSPNPARLKLCVNNSLQAHWVSAPARALGRAGDAPAGSGQVRDALQSAPCTAGSQGEEALELWSHLPKAVLWPFAGCAKPSRGSPEPRHPQARSHQVTEMP